MGQRSANPSSKSEHPALEFSSKVREGSLSFIAVGGRGVARATKYSQNILPQSELRHFFLNPSIGTFANPSIGIFTEIFFMDFERSDFDQSDTKDFLMSEHLTILNIVFSSLDILPPLLG